MQTFCWFVVVCSALVDAQRVVDTEYGQVRGHTINVNNGIEQTTVDVFYGIPFAKEPTGARRFKNPEPPDPWTVILEADTIRDMCSQYKGLIELSLPDWNDYSEDCLHINIYTPSTPPEPGSPYPVMVYMYGGAYQQGGSVQYPGHFLASRGIVVAIPNYRVGKFGYAFTGNDACPGNAGMWDQLAGLQFVVNNIANFGGDPNKITMFGESAGATSTSLHLLSPQSKDLFHQAIVQSGAETNDWAYNEPETHPEDYTYQIAEDLGCLNDDDYQMMDCLRDKPWRQLLDNSSVICNPGYICVGMAPVVDGPGGFLPQTPVQLRNSGNVMSGPLISGINKEDGSLFLPIRVPGVVAEDCCNITYFSYALRWNIVGYFDSRLTNITADECYHAFDFNYTPWPHLCDNAVNRDMLVKLYTDWQYAVPWDRQIKEHQTVGTTYGYLYDYMSSNSTLANWYGTVHAAEVDYVWGYPLMDMNDEVRNDSMFPIEDETYNAIDIQYTIFMQDLWTNFAKYGDPTPTPVNNPLGGSTTWPQFNTDTYDILYLGEDSIDTIYEYRQKDFAFWSNYIMWMAGDELETGYDWPTSEVVDGYNTIWDPEVLRYALSGELSEDDLLKL